MPKGYPGSNPPQEYSCAQCGESFQRRYFPSKPNLPLYCSSLCFNLARKTLRTKYICGYCGKEFERLECRIRSNKVFCSRTCADKVRPTGPEHHRWLANKNPDYGSNWRIQRQLVKQRDGYQCRICNAKHDLVAHHYKSIREFNNNWELGNQLSNLITLCRSCHSLVEHESIPCPHPTAC